MPDWNWFFSSLAQSTAAIVGIFGAFIITKILSNQSEYSQKKSRLKEMLIRSQRLVDDAQALAFLWYVKRTNENEIDKLEELLQKDKSQTPAKLYDLLNFSEFYPRADALDLIESSIIDLIKTKQMSEYDSVLNRINVSNLNSSMLNSSLSNAIDKEYESIHFTLREIRSNIRTIKDFLDSAHNNPESSPQITYSLLLIVALFFAGVIYPLSFLPVPNIDEVRISIDAFLPLLFSLRGALLTAVSIIFMSIVVIFHNKPAPKV